MAIYHELSDEKFAGTYEKYSAYVKGTLANSGCPMDQIDDVSQEAWSRAWEKRDMFDPSKGSLKIWLGVVAKRVWNNLLKAQYAEPEMVSLSQLEDYGDNPVEEDNFYPSVPSPDALSNLQMDISKLLKADEMELLKLHLEGMNSVEIADKLGINRVTVRTRMLRIRNTLQAAGVYSTGSTGR